MIKLIKCSVFYEFNLIVLYRILFLLSYDHDDSDFGPVYTREHGQFFSETIQILDNKLLEPGDLNFPFYFELPTNMPPTSKSEGYSINYLIEARLIPKEEYSFV